MYNLCIVQKNEGLIMQFASSSLLLYLEQQLVLHDPLDGLDEQVVELQPVAKLQP